MRRFQNFLLIPVIAVSVLVVASLMTATPTQAAPGQPPAPDPDGVVWTKVGTVKHVTGNYTPVIVTPTGITVFANTDGRTDGQWYTRPGSWSSVASKASVVIPSEAIYDEPCGANAYCIRTTAAVRGPSGKCYAMLTVGNGYPTTDSYRPAWATSDDCKTWTYHGRMLIEGSYQGYGQTDTGAMIVQEDGPDIPDHTNPGVNKYLVYENYQDIEGASPKLILLYSADGISWFRARDAAGVIIDVWPAGVNGPAFPSAARTPNGFHVIAADTWPATAHVHVFSCDGVHFRVLETNSDTWNGNAKGTNLVYDGATNLLHALTAGTHFQIAEQAYACP